MALVKIGTESKTKVNPAQNFFLLPGGEGLRMRARLSTVSLTPNPDVFMECYEAKMKKEEAEKGETEPSQPDAQSSQIKVTKDFRKKTAEFITNHVKFFLHCVTFFRPGFRIGWYYETTNLHYGGFRRYCCARCWHQSHQNRA
ncbi:MAG TPA: hypothetical protein VH595_05545 [Verrucomicrobiae bacterium]|jgi:hypothetical protein|nr:hypothetical protein [Verrucomicrobiae bacterium]